MRFRLVERRTLWIPTFFGWCLIFLAGGGSSLAWWFLGENFLGITERCPADVLVVEGWIGPAGVKAAATEFQRGGYRYVVGTGGLSGEPWDEQRWNFAKEAEKVLLRSGIPTNCVLVASTGETDNQRTYTAAIMAQRSLHEAGVNVKALNVFTEGAHARRSRLVFEKAFGNLPCVGVISWRPPGYDRVPWWRSSERAIDFLKETVAYPLEKLFNSGRRSTAVP